MKNLVLLEGLTGDVQWQILRVDDTLDEVQPFRHQLITVIHDEHTADVKLDVVALLLGLKQVEWRRMAHDGARRARL